MSIRHLRVCDGCGKELTRTQDIYHLSLRTDRFFDGVDSDYFEKELDFCERCAKSIKQTLETIAERGRPMKINPAASIYYRPQPVKRGQAPGIRELTLDVPEPEIREQEKEDAFSRQISIASQALFCFAIILLFLNIINQVVKLCF